MVRRRRAGRIGRHRPLIPATEPIGPHTATRLFTADRSDGRLFFVAFPIPAQRQTHSLRHRRKSALSRQSLSSSFPPPNFDEKEKRPPPMSRRPKTVPAKVRPDIRSLRVTVPTNPHAKIVAPRNDDSGERIRKNNCLSPLSQRKFRLSSISVLHIAKLNCILAVRNQIKIYIHGKFQTSYFQRTGSGCPAG